jgi:hypothetical protein
MTRNAARSAPFAAARRDRLGIAPDRCTSEGARPTVPSLQSATARRLASEPPQGPRTAPPRPRLGWARPCPHPIAGRARSASPSLRRARFSRRSMVRWDAPAIASSGVETAVRSRRTSQSISSRSSQASLTGKARSGPSLSAARTPRCEHAAVARGERDDAACARRGWSTASVKPPLRGLGDRQATAAAS